MLVLAIFQIDLFSTCFQMHYTILHSFFNFSDTSYVHYSLCPYNNILPVQLSPVQPVRTTIPLTGVQAMETLETLTLEIPDLDPRTLNKKENCTNWNTTQNVRTEDR